MGSQGSFLEPRIVRTRDGAGKDEGGAALGGSERASASLLLILSSELETQSDWRGSRGMPRPSEMMLVSQALAIV